MSKPGDKAIYNTAKTGAHNTSRYWLIEHFWILILLGHFQPICKWIMLYIWARLQVVSVTEFSHRTTVILVIIMVTIFINIIHLTGRYARGQGQVWECDRICPQYLCHHHEHQYNLHHHYTIYISLENMVEAKDKSGSVTDEEESNDWAANSSKMEIHSSPGGGDDDYGEIWRCIRWWQCWLW